MTTKSIGRVACVLPENKSVMHMHVFIFDFCNEFITEGYFVLKVVARWRECNCHHSISSAVKLAKQLYEKL